MICLLCFLLVGGCFSKSGDDVKLGELVREVDLIQPEERNLRFLDPEAARQYEKWKSKKVSWYQFNAEIHLGAMSCQVPITFEVKESKVIAAHANENEFCGTDRYKKFETVEKMFGVIERESRNSKKEIRVVFDPEYGFPRKINIDHNPLVTDMFEGFEVTDFREVFEG